MTTLYGSWVGSGVRARMRCDYTVSYTADHTQAIYKGTIYVEFDQSIYDNVNSVGISGDDGSHTYTNVTVNMGSGGGLLAIYSNFTFQGYGNGLIAASMYNVEGVGATITATFNLPNGGVAPYWAPDDYYATAISQTGFSVVNLHAAPNGGSLTNVQLEYATGGTITPGAFQNITATGLTPNTTYTYRLRPCNSTYGWGAWGAWKTVTTLPTVPNPALESWYCTDIKQTSVYVTGLWYSYDGGSPIDFILVRMADNPSMIGYWDYTCGWNGIGIGGLQAGKTYYIQVFLHNAYGYSNPTAVKGFTTLPGVSVNVGGVWKDALPYVNVNGVWKPAERYVNVGGVWKQ